MKHLKLFEKFAQDYENEYGKVAYKIKAEVIQEINDIFDKLKTHILYIDNKNGPVTQIKNDYNLIYILKNDNDLYVNSYNSEDESSIDDLSVEDIIKIYSHFEDITLTDLLYNLFEDEKSDDMARLYKNNYDRIDLGDMIGTGENFLQLWERDKYSFFNHDEDDVINNYNTQKWIIDNNKDFMKWFKDNDIELCDETKNLYKVQKWIIKHNKKYMDWFKDNDVIIDKKIRKEYSDLDAFAEGKGMGFFDLVKENKENISDKEKLEKIKLCVDIFGQKCEKTNLRSVDDVIEINMDNIPWYDDEVIINLTRVLSDREHKYYVIYDNPSDPFYNDPENIETYGGYENSLHYEENIDNEYMKNHINIIYNHLVKKYPDFFENPSPYIEGKGMGFFDLKN